MKTGHIVVTAADFKAKCLAMLDRVHQDGLEVTITKRGRVVARLVAATGVDDRPWERVRGTARWPGDPFTPVVEPSDISGLK